MARRRREGEDRPEPVTHPIGPDDKQGSKNGEEREKKAHKQRTKKQSERATRSGCAHSEPPSIAFFIFASENVGGGSHRAEEFSHGRFGSGSGKDTKGADHEVGYGTVRGWVGGLVMAEIGHSAVCCILSCNGSVQVAMSA